jgi:hypothetical protein
VLSLAQALKVAICFFTAHLIVRDGAVQPLRGVSEADVPSRVFELGRPFRRT